MKRVDIETLPILGKTCTSVTRKGNEEIVFECSDGSVYRMHHYQDCCENVEIDNKMPSNKRLNFFMINLVSLI